MNSPQPILAFNACAFFVGSAGVRRFALSAADALLDGPLAPRVRIFAPSCRRAALPPRFLSCTIFFWAPDPRRGTAFNNLFWTNLLSLHLRFRHPDAVVYSPLEAFAIIPFSRSIVTAHDCYADRFGDPRSPGRPGLGRQLCVRQLKRSRVLSVSEFTTRELAEIHGLRAPQVETVLNWLDRGYDNAPTLDRLAAVRTRLHLPAAFWLYVGGFRLNKNLPFLFEAYVEARTHNPRCPPLVIAGQFPARDTPFSGPFHTALDRYPGLREHIIMPGFIPDADLPALYKLASLVICPSSYEGFGFPVIEALAVGSPVIAAQAASLTEFGLPTANLFSLNDTTELVSLLDQAAREGSHNLKAPLPKKFLFAAGENRFRAAIEHGMSPIPCSG